MDVPEHPSAIMNLANARVALGKIDDAVPLFRRAIELEPKGAQCHWGLANAVKASTTDHIAEMQALLDADTHSLRQKSFLYYAVGKESEDLREDLHFPSLPRNTKSSFGEANVYRHRAEPASQQYDRLSMPLPRLPVPNDTEHLWVQVQLLV